MKNFNKKVLFIIGLGLILIAITFGVYKYIKSNNAYKASLINYQDLHLTSEQKEVFLKNIDEFKKRLNDANKDEDRAKITMQIGLQYYGLGEYKLAHDQYILANTLAPNNPTIFAELYVIENVMKDYKNAIKHIKKATDLSPQNADYWRWYIEIEKDVFMVKEEALDKIFAEALIKTKKNVDMVTFYAKYLEEYKHDLQGAIEQWTKAIELNPSTKSIYEVEINRLKSLLK